MESVHENSRIANPKKEVFSEMAELLEKAGLLTKEEKNCMKNMIWQEEILKRNGKVMDDR